MAPEARIPAWKRLGLKLVGAKRPAEEAPEPNSQPESHISKKRKAVSFSTESKAKDGSKTDHLLDNFINSQHGGPGQFTPEEASQFGKKAQPQLQKPKKSQPKGKKKKGQKSPSESAQPSTPGYITYLVQFHTDKEHWKFNKVKQNQLLKHIFDTDSPLAEHMEAVEAYVKGLKGEEARNRLRTTGLEIAELSDAARDVLRQELLDVKVRLREAADLEESKKPAFKKKLQRREQALRVLLALELDLPVEWVRQSGLGAVEDTRYTNQLTKRVLEVNTPDGAVLKKQRIRIKKIRTLHPDDDVESVSSVDSIPTADTTPEEESSSDESSSDESSSDESSSDEESSSDGSAEEESSSPSEESSSEEEDGSDEEESSTEVGDRS
jgi:hypothetical protein